MKKLILLFLLDCIICISVSAQELSYKQFTTADGLPSMTIYEIVQDSMGLLWMGTENGLVFFDGEEFTRFSDPRLKDNDILEVEISKDGHVTFANAANQYVRLERGEVKIFETGFRNYTELVSGTENDFILDNNSPMNSGFIYVFDNGLDTLFVGNFEAYLIDGLGVLKIKTGISESESWGDLNSVKRLDQPLEFIIDPLSTYHTQSSYINIELNKEEVTMLKKHFSKSQFYGKRKDSYTFDNKTFLRCDDKLYIGGISGLHLFDHNSGELEKGIIAKDVNYLFLDREKNIWVSTNQEGLIQLNSKRKSYDFFRDGEILDVDYFRDNLVVLTNKSITFLDSSLSLIKKFDFEYVSKKQMQLNDRGLFVFAISDVFYFDYDSLSVSQFSTLHNSIISKAASLIDHENYHKPLNEKEHFQNIWGVQAKVSTDEFLFLAAKDKIRQFNKIESIDELQSRSGEIIINLDKINVVKYSSMQEDLLIGTDNGFYSFGINTKSLSSLNRVIDSEHVSCILVTNDSIFVGTANNGVYIISVNDYDVGRKLNLSCLNSTKINSIKTFNDKVYISNAEGIVEYNPLEPNDCNSLSVYDGLLSKNVDDLLIKSSDATYIIHQNAIQIFNIEDFNAVHFVPNLYLEEVNIEFENFVFSNGEILDFSQNDIEIKYNFVIFKEVGSKKIKYRINDDENWSYSKEMKVRLPSLRPGKYTLEAVGIYSSNKETKPIKTEFTILPPWWQTWWARFLLLISVLALGFFTVRRREKQLNERESEKRKYIEQINRVKDQALQLQMNPHFIFNAMNAIQNFITNNNDEMAVKFLAKFARLIRMIFEYSKDSLITMEQELDFVSLYLDLEMLRFGGKIDLSFDVDDEVNSSKDVLKIPPLLIQPIIENSFKHGLFHKKGLGRLMISYQMDNNQIKITVEDNGIGRVAANSYRNKGKDIAVSSGISNIRERLDILNFNSGSNYNQIRIDDLKVNGQPSGTRTIITIHIKDNTYEYA